MNDILRQVSVLITVLGAIFINFLANALPLNGLNTGQISDRFQVYFVPAGYVFSIWGLIYLGLVAFAVYQTLPSQRHNPRLRAAGWWVGLSGLANSAWIFLWHYEQFPLTLAAMLLLLLSLMLVYLGLRSGSEPVSQAEMWAARLPFSIYLGWITVATIANITSLLDYLSWDGFGLASETWFILVLAAVLLIAALVSFTRRDAAFILVILWALAGIAVKHAGVPLVANATWIAFLLVALALAAALLNARRPQAQAS